MYFYKNPFYTFRNTIDLMDIVKE